MHQTQHSCAAVCRPQTSCRQRWKTRVWQRSGATAFRCAAWGGSWLKLQSLGSCRELLKLCGRCWHSVADLWAQAHMPAFFFAQKFECCGRHESVYTKFC